MYKNTKNRCFFVIHIFLTFFIGAQIAACTLISRQPEISVPSSLPSESVPKPYSGEVSIDSHLVIPTPTQDAHSQPTYPTSLPDVCANINSKVNVRITYAVFNENANNEITDSRMYILDPPYVSSQLIYASKGSDSIDISNSPISWSSDLQKISFSVLSNNDFKSVYIYDTALKNISPVLSSINSNYQVVFPGFDWSLDGQWLSILIDEGYATQSHIVNVNTRNDIALDYITQEQMLGWRPLHAQEFITMSYPDFPNEDKVIVSLRILGKAAPARNFVFPNGYTVLMDWRWSFFSISPDGNLAVFKSQTTSSSFSYMPVYLFLNLDTGEWSKYAPDHDISLTRFWSPDSRYLAFISNYGLQILDIREYRLTNILSNPTAKPLGWLPGWLIFENNHKIFGVSTKRPENQCLIQDIKPILRDVSPFFWIDLIFQ